MSFQTFVAHVKNTENPTWLSPILRGKEFHLKLDRSCSSFLDSLYFSCPVGPLKKYFKNLSSHHFVDTVNTYVNVIVLVRRWDLIYIYIPQAVLTFDQSLFCSHTEVQIIFKIIGFGKPSCMQTKVISLLQSCKIYILPWRLPIRSLNFCFLISVLSQ